MPTQAHFSYRGLSAVKSSVLATGTTTLNTRGIHVNVAGTITGQLEGDSVDSTWVVNAGGTYSYVFKSITSLGTATGNFLF